MELDHVVEVRKFAHKFDPLPEDYTIILAITRVAHLPPLQLRGEVRGQPAVAVCLGVVPRRSVLAVVAVDSAIEIEYRYIPIYLYGQVPERCDHRALRLSARVRRVLACSPSPRAAATTV